ncbi:hypothetical protein [Azospirillum sp. Sh1]|uniref:hypothetical protein n=1 Tax=Azospirillum sp. Sh1 TaxID=2607285 RepID=UPI0011EBB30C|nr:hypothetical protein [Azospirillum sp. Sh1]KAA0580828.1 hypothetical protein FZ029_05555 [Azospirillum sp. Sh1]
MRNRICFGKGVVDDARARILDATESISYKPNDAFGEFYTLIHLRDELLDFQRDLNCILRNGHSDRSAFAVDDVSLRSFAELDDNARRYFSFPIPVEGEERQKIMEIRGAEYLFRLETMLFGRDANPVLLPPNAENCRDHIQYFSSGQRNKTLSLNWNTLRSLVTPAVEKLENDRGLYGEWIAQNRNLLNRDPRLISFNNPVAQDELLSAWTRDEASISVGLLAIASLEHGEQVLERYRKLFDREESRIRFFNEIDATCISEKVKDKEGFQKSLRNLQREDGITEYVGITEGIFDLLYTLDGINKTLSKHGSSRNEGYMWRAAMSATYVHAVNDLLVQHGGESTFQLVTHRTLLGRVIRTFREGELLVPVRHPKFLAATLPLSVAKDVYPSLERINSVLGGFVRAALNSREVTVEEIRKIEDRISPSWTALKRKIYSSEAGYVAERFNAEQKQLRGGRNPNLEKARAYVAVHALEDSDPKTVLLAFLRERTDALLRDTILSALARTELQAYYVPEREREPAHWMILPRAGKLRYVVKINPQMLDDASTASVKHRKLDLERLLRESGSVGANSLAGQLTIFATALAAAIVGNWNVAIDYLDRDRIDGIRDRDLNAECRFIKHLALRGLASQKKRLRSQVLTNLSDASETITLLNQEKPSDLRFRLGCAGTILEWLVLGDLKTTDAQDAFETVFGFPHYQATLKAMELCFGVTREIDDNLAACPDASESQKVYWHYIKARSLQILLTLYMAVWGEETPNPHLDYIRIAIAKETRAEWPNVFKQYNDVWNVLEKTWADLQNGERDHAGWKRTAFHRDCAVEEQYPAATLAWHFGKLIFDLNGGKLFDPNAGISPIEKLTTLSSNIQDVYSCLSGIESSCLRLSFDGYPRRLFRTVKKKLYKVVEDNINDINKEAFYELTESIRRTAR